DNSADKNENTSRTSCNKNGYFNKKASHFRKNNSSASKSCFVYGSYLHLIKDCNYYETQYANDFDGVGYPQRQPIWDNATMVTQTNQFVPQVVRLRSGKVSIPAARPNQVPAGRPKPVSTGRPKPVSTGRPKPVSTCKQYRPPPVHAGRRTSSSVTSGWWQSTARPMNHLPTPTSSYFQTSTPFGPHVYYNQMQYDGDGWATAIKPSAGCSWKSYRNKVYRVNLHTDAGDEGIVDSGCSRSMTGNKERLDDFQPFKGGKVTFGGGEGRITGKGTIRTPKLDFENVYYVKELQQFNLFSVSQICDKKNRVLFTDTDCLVLSNDFKLPDESMVLLRVPRKHNLYTFNLNNLAPKENLACLVAKASSDEAVKWHRRMAHVNYKNMNKLVQDNLVRGLPPKLFKNDHTCVACCKGKQHKATYKAITAVSSISEPLQLLHMDLFGPTSIRSIDHKFYCLVITDDYSRFCWVFFLETKDETYSILKDFISLVENQLNKKVKAIRCDNGTEFKNAKLIELCGEKGIKRDYSNARTPQQNGVAERKNRTLIEAARTMLADSKLPTMFWTEAVSTACYVLNRVLITNPHNKTPYALLTGKTPSISHFKPFGCHVTILNTSDHLGKFDGKADEGYLVGYSASNRAYRVYNMANKRVEETMNLRFLEEKANIQGIGHEWSFDLDYLTDSLGYNRDKANQSAGTQDVSSNPAGFQDDDSDSDSDEQVILVPSYPSNNIPGAEPKDTSDAHSNGVLVDTAEDIFQQELARLKDQEQRATSDAERLGLGFAKDAEELQKRASAKTVPPGSIPVPTGSIPVPSGDTMVSPSDVSVPTGGVPVPSGSPTDSFFDDEALSRSPRQTQVNLHTDAGDEGIIDSGCSSSMTGNKERLDDFQPFKGGKVTFGGVSQICDKKNRVLFIDTDCLVLSNDFKLPDESMVLLRVPRKHNLYTFNLNNLARKENLACLVAKASSDKAVKWHRRMDHVNYKNMNKLVKDNLVSGLPPKFFKNDHTYVACCKGKQHKATYKAIIARDYSNARTPQQNRVAERKNRTLIEAARTMLADSKLPTMFWTEAVSTACYVLNRVLITNPHNKTPYALLTGKTPSISHFKPFGCHVTILNTSDHLGKFDGKADEGYLVRYSASNRAYKVYNITNKRVEEIMNLRFLEEKANIQGIGHAWSFDHDYLTDSLGYNRDIANQSAGTQGVSSNPAGFQDDDSDSNNDEQVILVPSYPSNNIPGAKPKDTSDAHSNGVLVDTTEDIFQQELARLKGQEQRATSDGEILGLGFAKDAEELQKRASGKTVPLGSIPIPSGDTMVSPSDVPVPFGSPTDTFSDAEPTTLFSSPSDLRNNVPLPGIFSSTSYDDEFGADLNNLASTVEVSPVATKRINTVHPQSLIIGEPNSSVQTRSQVHKKTPGETAFLSYIQDQQRNNHTDFQHCLFACFLSQVEPRSVAQALEDPSWVDAMQAEMK
ncbi:putative ribonuclease H-like domain-containing protein, partial [Tanacetum coccineum]